MKKLIHFAVLTILVGLAACGDKKDDQTVAQTPVPTSQCLTNMGAYGNGGCTYNYGQNPPFQNYPIDYHQVQMGYANGFCGCQSGFRPVYNSGWGLGCVEGRYTTQNTNYMGYYWQFGGSINSSWINIPQISVSPTSSGNCYQDAMYACDPTIANSCGTAGTCVALGGARIGVCQYRNGYQYNYNNYNNYGGYYYYNNNFRTF